MSQLCDIDVDLIRVATNDRKTFDDAKIAELAASIAEVGQAEPIIVAVDGTGYELVAGERRLRAVRLLGWAQINAIVRDLSDAERSALMLAENTGRVDLSIMEEARAYRRRLEAGVHVRAIARQAGVATFRVEWRLSLLSLTDEAQAAIESGALSPAAALEMRRLDGDRQMVALKAWLANPSMGTAAFKSLCVDLAAAAVEADTFEMFTDEWVARAEAARPRPSVSTLTVLVSRMADALQQAGYAGPLLTEALTATGRNMQ